MIYRCWHCGWRIRQRKEGEADNPRIGKHELWNHHPFCSDYCIELYKKQVKKTGDILPEAPCSDWEENDVYGYGYWKIERKRAEN